MFVLKSVLATLVLALQASAGTCTLPPAGAKIVALSGGSYISLQAAINSIDKASTATTSIFIRPGTYTGQTTITSGYKGKIVIHGYTTNDQSFAANQVILTHKLSSNEAGGNEQSGTLRISSPNVSVYNIRFQNTAGDAGPSHALSINADRAAFYGCAFTGWQDTMFGKSTNAVFKNSYIEGAVDFIYGGENCNLWFETCEIGIARANGGYITASGRNSDESAWYVLNNSKVYAKSGVSVSSGTVWLGRPWRAYARVVFQKTDLTNIIQPEGWNPWDKGADLSHIYYGEYANTGSGASTSNRVSWSKKLSSAVTIDITMPAWKDFVDQAYWNNVAGGANACPTGAITTTISTNAATTIQNSRATSASPSGCTSPQWGQCGGIQFTGCTTCISGTVCTFSNEWYSQCL